MKFLTENEPAHGLALPVVPGIWRVVANNPGPMTCHGTNTYLIEDDEGMSVLDPGPDDASHVEAVLAAAGGRINRILLSHGHRDHTGGLARLRALNEAPVFGFSPSIDPAVVIDHPLAEGDEVAGLAVLYTPGHAPDHLCFATRNHCLLSGDHVMAWATSVVAPPGGDMALYIESLRRLAGRDDDRYYLPGHGPLLGRPQGFVRALLAHRIAREKTIAVALGPEPHTVADLALAIYPGLDAKLRRAAERMVESHLIKLERDGRARAAGERWAEA